MKARLFVFVACFGACQTAAPLVESDHARSAPNARSCKPEAPIAVEVATREVGANELEITARVVPTATVPSIDLALALPAHAGASTATEARFGATTAGEPRVLTARVQLADRRSSSITAIARVVVDGIDMSRTATVAVGMPKPAPRTRTYALPDGELAREVRP
ncbi:MAG TPA: hypothetical protein VIV11_41435 [Kofleriaceae bacterium]